MLLSFQIERGFGFDIHQGDSHARNGHVRLAFAKTSHRLTARILFTVRDDHSVIVVDVELLRVLRASNNAVSEHLHPARSSFSASAQATHTAAVWINSLRSLFLISRRLVISITGVTSCS